MNAKRCMGITLALLVLGGQAQAITGQEIGDALTSGFKISPNGFFNDPLGSILKGLSGSFDSAFNVAGQKVFGDITAPIFGKKNSVQDSASQYIFGDVKLPEGVSKIESKAWEEMLKNPFNPNMPLQFEKAAKDTSDTLNKLASEGFDKLFNKEKKSADPGSGGPVSPLGDKIVSLVSSKNLLDVKIAVGGDSLNKAQAYKLADLATNEDAIALNAANRKRMEASTKKLATDTGNAVSTRATVQALNVAVGSLMAQEVFGNERLQDRLNLMLLQGARTNDQIGDLVSVFRKQDAQKIKDYNTSIDAAQANAKSDISRFNNSISTIKQTLNNGTYGSDIAVKAASINDIEKLGPEFNASGKITAGGPMPDGSDASSDSTGITESPTIDTPSENPTTERTGPPYAPEDCNPIEDVYRKECDLPKNPSSGSNKTQPSASPTANNTTENIKFLSPEYFATQRYKDQKRAYDNEVWMKDCLIDDPKDTGCVYNEPGRIRPAKGRALTAEQDKLIDSVNPDRVDVLIPLF